MSFFFFFSFCCRGREKNYSPVSSWSSIINHHPDKRTFLFLRVSRFSSWILSTGKRGDSSCSNFALHLYSHFFPLCLIWSVPSFLLVNVTVLLYVSFHISKWKVKWNKTIFFLCPSLCLLLWKAISFLSHICLLLFLLLQHHWVSITLLHNHLSWLSWWRWWHISSLFHLLFFPYHLHLLFRTHYCFILFSVRDPFFSKGRRCFSYGNAFWYRFFFFSFSSYLLLLMPPPFLLMLLHQSLQFLLLWPKSYSFPWYSMCFCLIFSLFSSPELHVIQAVSRFPLVRPGDAILFTLVQSGRRERYREETRKHCRR